MRHPRRQAGLTLVELTVAMALAVIVIAALNGVLLLGFQAQAAGRQSNELAAQGQYAMQRMIAAARNTAPKRLSTPTLANTTGDWFAPTMYCIAAGNRLIETTTADTACAGTAVVADNVISLSAQLPAGAGPLDEPLGTLAITLRSGDVPVVFSTSIRLGGGTL